MTVKSAVILAAGLGSRLGQRTSSIPKGLLSVGGMPLVERSVRLLKEFGIEKIYLGTGYLAEQYNVFAKQFSEVSCILSPLYETTSSMYTLYNMRSDLNEPFLLLESDLLYESRALSEILSVPAENVILASGPTLSGDEVYIETDISGNLVNVSKKKSELRSTDAELVGINKISPSLYQTMCQVMETSLVNQPKIDYEKAFVLSTNRHAIAVHKVPDLVWGEIDDESHLSRASSLLLPKLKAIGESVC